MMLRLLEVVSKPVQRSPDAMLSKQFLLRNRVLKLLVCVLCFISASTSLAAEGKPVAVRWWGQGMVSVESYWNLHVVVDPYAKSVAGKTQPVAADVVLLTHADLTPANIRTIDRKPTLSLIHI